MWTLQLHRGLRPGEAAGLSWSDIDETAGIVHVRRGLKRGAHGRLVIGTPETAWSIRSLDASQDVMSALKKRRQAQRHERLAAGELWSNPEDLIFTNGLGHPIDPARRRIEFDAVQRRAGLDGFTPNMLRHTAASLMADAGVPLETVADQLGHRDTRMASLHYRHRVRPTISAGTVLGNVLRES